MHEFNKENKVYFYGFDKSHQLHGKPWHLRGDWITIGNIHDTADRMLRLMDICEVVVVDGSIEVGREYKNLTKLANYKKATEHILFHEFIKTKENFTFRK